MKSTLVFSTILWALASSANAQPPAGPTLDFTLNYINAALMDGSISLDGTVLTLKGSGGYQIVSVDLLVVAVPAISEFVPGSATLKTTDRYVVILNCPAKQECVHNRWTEPPSGGQFAGQVTDSEISSFNLAVKETSTKAQDVANAMTHLVMLVRALQQQQNQGDPFAKPQQE